VENKESSGKMATKVLIPRMHKPEMVATMSSSCENLSRSTPGRKRKLDHLSPEEKVQRKKLKNRVAAQTSRDRKKRQVEDMLDTMDAQTRTIASWESKYKQLQAKYDKLERELKKLKASKQQEAVKHHSIPEEHKYTRVAEDEMTENDNCADSGCIKSEGPAVSIIKPLPKVSKMQSESTQKSSKKFRHESQNTKMLLQLIMLCLFYKSSLKTSTSKKSPMTSSTISTKALRQMIQKVASQMPRFKAENAHCLDQWWGSHNRQWNPMGIEVAQ
jgi:hypothetical protein